MNKYTIQAKQLLQVRVAVRVHRGILQLLHCMVAPVRKTAVYPNSHSIFVVATVVLC